MKRWLQVAARYPWVWCVVVLVAAPALARIGGGEHYTGPASDDRDGGSDGSAETLVYLIVLAIEHPVCGVPLLLAFCGCMFYRWRAQGDSTTAKAIAFADGQRRTQVSPQLVSGWVSALQAKDPTFDLLHLLDNTKKLFVELQRAWFGRQLEPVRRYLSDATYQRLSVQLALLAAAGVRDAIAEPTVLDLKLVGLEQSQWFDTAHIMVRAQMRDTDVPATASDAEALAIASKENPSQFVEVWSFVRKPGALTKPNQELFAGACPNCGAPFGGGASNRCDHCGGVVNSGNYDWVLAEITQGSEYSRANGAVEGFSRARQNDPALNTEALEDRAALCFWKWVEAQATHEVSRLTKVATAPFRERTAAELSALAGASRRRLYRECAIGAVETRKLEAVGDRERAHVEVRWSARLADGPARPIPQRSVLTLERSSSAKTHVEHGLSSYRCSNCHAPATDNGETVCEFCGHAFDAADGDWVLGDLRTWEAYRGATPSSGPSAAHVPPLEERERLVYLMAAVAAADGVVDARERALLRECAERWGVSFANVELALGAGDGLFTRLLAKGSTDAEALLCELVQLAKADGAIDRKERKLLDAAAAHLGLVDRLPSLLGR